MNSKGLVAADPRQVAKGNLAATLAQQGDLAQAAKLEKEAPRVSASAESRVTRIRPQT